MGSINCKQYGTDNSTHAQQNGSAGQCDQMESNKDYIEAIVCQENEIDNNEIKQLVFSEEEKILLIKQNGKYSALGTKCPHYGALLSTGALGEGRIRCPWHGACFNTTTGDVEDFPGLDSLPCHQVIIEKGQVKVRAKRSDLENSKRIKDMVKYDPKTDESIVIIGGGPSGAVCAETLRQEGFTGRIVMICKENALPYDRIKISKAMDVALDKIEFRKREFYDEYGIEALTGVEAKSLETQSKSITCSNGYQIRYDKVFIATGCTPARPNIPGINLKNVFTVRDHQDAVSIYKLLEPEAEVVCLGSSFISLESAAYCVNKVKKVTLIGRENVPLKVSFGDEVGERVLQLFTENKVNMVMNNGIKEFIGNDDGKVVAVVLNDDTKLSCDLCILGTGSKLNTEFLKNSAIHINPDGSIDADMHLRTNVPDVFVGGDIANAPVYPLANHRATIGHYQLAQYHGRIAALNMAGKKQDLRAVPFFWTVLFGKSFRYSGYGKPVEVRIEGDLADLKFVAMYFDKDGNVISMASCARDPIVAQFAELQTQGWRLHKNDLNHDPFNWTTFLTKK